MINDVQSETSCAVGYRKMTYIIRKRTGKHVNRKRVLSLMRRHGMLSAVRRKQYSDEVYLKRRQMKGTEPPDLINRWFFSLSPRTLFAEDITYLFYLGGTLYLNTIIDLFNKQVVAWLWGDRPDSDLCEDTVRKLAASCDLRGTVIHSDHGSSYNSWSYRQLLKDLGVRQSCGTKADCYDNAAMESFNGILKAEGLYNKFGKTKILNHRIEREDIIARVEWFIPWYNNVRPKKDLGGLSPAEFLERNPKGTYPVLIS